MRIVRWPGTPATLVKVRTRAEVIVAVPARLPAARVHDLARLLLSSREFDEFAALVGDPDQAGDGPAVPGTG